MDETKTIEDSADGKTNGYILTCSAIGQRRYYASCVHILGQLGNTKLEPLYGDCFDAIKKKTCPAARMRKEEAEAGKGIYFAERKMVEMVAPVTSEDARDGKESKNSKRRRTTVAAPVYESVIEKPVDTIGSMNFADAINEAMKNIPAAPPPAPKPVSSVAAKPGESLLDIARRKLAERTAKEVSH